MDSVETELSDAKKAVRDLALKIEEANSRAKGPHRKPKWREQEEPETSVKNMEDDRYAQVMKELEHMKQELGKLKLDMTRVLKQKRHADRASKASNSKTSTLSASVELMKKEIQELGEEQTLVELARLQAVNEREAIEAQRKEEQARLIEAKKNVQEKEKTREPEITLSDIDLLQSELNMVKEMERTSHKQEVSQLTTITDELEAAKLELASVKRQGFNFMTSMDVIRDELKHVRDETARLHKSEQKHDVTVQNLNSKILRVKAKLEALTKSEAKTATVASNLSITLQQLRAETDAAKKEKDLINDEIENIKGEIQETEFAIELTEEKLEAAMEELKAVKSSESKALMNLRNLINTTVEARVMASVNRSTIMITDFEYEYLNRTAGGAAELADNKIAAARAWVEALEANEREILMKVERNRKEMSELNIEEDEEEEACETQLQARSGTKVVALGRKSVTMASVKRAKIQKLRSPASRHTTKSGSLKKEKVMPKLSKLFSKKKMAMEE